MLKISSLPMNIKLSHLKGINIFLAYAYTFILLYNPQIFGIPTQRVVLYPLSVIYFFLSRSNLYKNEKKLLLWAILCVCIGFSNTLLQATNDFGMLLISRVFFGVLGANLIFNTLKHANNYRITEITPLKLVAYTGVAQSIIVLLGFFVPEIKGLLLELNTTSDFMDKKMAGLALVRGIGWGTFQYAHLAILTGSSFICYIYIATIKNYKSLYQKLITIVISLIFVVAGILTARSFFIILFVGICYWTYIYIANYGICGYVKIVSICLGVVSTFGVYLFVQFSDVVSEQTINWAFELFNNFAINGKFESDSTDLLATMWHFPDNLKTWFFGDARTAGLHGNYNYTLSDIGIINSLYCWGLIGSVFYYLCLYKSFKYSIDISKDKNIRLLIWLVLLINFGYQFKETLNLFPISCIFLAGEIFSYYKGQKSTKKFGCEYGHWCQGINNNCKL